MKAVLTPRQMAAADEAAIASGTPADVLMERAGRAVARTALTLAGGRYGRRAVVVCGKGNNGGDGFVAARVLRREGLGVVCLGVGDVSSSEGAARRNVERWIRSGGRVDAFDATALTDADVVVDALFGTGFRGRAEGEAAAAIAAIDAAPAPVVAVDIPSGIDGSTGRADGPAVRADVTVTMGAAKIGCVIGAGAERAGRVEVVDIGISIPPDADAFVSEALDVAAVIPRRTAEAHKRSVGSVALVAGSAGMSGAAVLAARGAARMGAGYVTLCCSEDVKRTSSEVSPEVLTRVSADGDALGPEALDRAKDVIDRADAVALGPGLGTGEDQRGLVERALRDIAQPLVLDADGLNVLERSSDLLRERPGPLVITPHPAELGRLLGTSAADIQQDRPAATREAARRWSCTVILKGFRSLIAAPSGRVVITPTGGPELATAGTGDVLTGATAALLAARIDAFEAAWATAYVHGAAGARAARRVGGGRVGGIGVLAWDVAEALPGAIEELRSST